MRRFWNLFRRRRLERDIAAELATHAALLAEANRAAGTHRRLGSDLALRERVRAADVPLWLDELLRDLTLAARSLARAPGFTLVAVLTLALGVGAATTMYSVINTVLLHPLPYPGAAQLVSVRMFVRSQGRTRYFVNVPAPVLAALAHSHAFASVGLIGYANDTVFVNGTARDASVSLASSHLFRTLGVHPQPGHGFSGNRHEALISDRFWRTQLGGTPAAIGKTIRVGSQLYNVAGVLPPGEAYPPYASVWIEGVPKPDETGEVIARLPDQLPLVQAKARARAALTLIARRHSRTLRQWTADGLALLPPLQQLAPAPARAALWMLFAAVACLLLVACANVANLLLCRGLAREQDLALRRALGAGRLRLARLLLAEGIWLGFAAAAAGAGLAWVFVRLARLGPAAVPRLSAVRLDPAALAFAATLATAAGLACSLAPALRLSAAPIRPRRAQPLHHAFVITEIALTLVLLTGGVLLLRSFNHLLRASPGFQIAHMTSIGVVAPDMLPGQKQRVIWPERSRTFQALLARVQALPGIAAGTYSNHRMFTGANGVFLHPLGTPAQDHSATDELEIGPDYFAAMGIPLLAGRSFTAAEESQYPGKSLPVVVNAALARQLWPKLAPSSVVGKRLLEWDAPDVVVGVVGNTRDNDDLGAAARPQIYFPFYGNFNRVQFLLRSSLPPSALARTMQALLPQESSHLVLTPPMALDAALQTALAQPRFRTLLLGIFAALSWLLALVGLYGVLAFQVRQRRREIGIRMALGAAPIAITRLVVRQSLVMLGIGITLGWVLSGLLARYMVSLLSGVGTYDPLSWFAAAAALLAVGLLASLLPARRALAVDPAESLRCE